MIVGVPFRRAEARQQQRPPAIERREPSLLIDTKATALVRDVLSSQGWTPNVSAVFAVRSARTLAG